MRSVLSPVRRRRWVSAGACLIPLLSVLVWGGGAAAALPISDSAEPLVADEAGYQRPGETERVSVASDGSEAEGSSVAPLGMDISADGRFVAFSSPAPNLVSGDTNGAVDVFVHDRATGATERVSVTSDANQGFHEDGYMYPSISDDGRYVAFCGDELLPGDASSALVYVHDRESRTTERIGPGCFPQLSADGRFLLAKPVGKPPWVHDRQTGISEVLPVSGPNFSLSISADGRYVALTSPLSDLVEGDTNLQDDVFVHDRDTGETERVSVASNGGEAEGRSWQNNSGQGISADGRYVTFVSNASNLVPGDTNPWWDVFVHDRDTGETERVSVASDGSEVIGGRSRLEEKSLYSAISDDGRFVTFGTWSQLTNITKAAGVSPNSLRAFLHDRQTGVTELVSMPSDGTEANGDVLQLLGQFLRISAGGQHVVFSSDASNLVPGDTNDSFDFFVRDRGPAIGIGALTVSGDRDELTGSGWATFSGALVASADDPSDDGVDVPGAEITGASAIYRPEQGDLLMRMNLASLPALGAPGCLQPLNCASSAVVSGVPGVLYRWSFTAGGAAYEVRGSPAAPGNPYFGLYECDLVCTETARLSGGIGTTGAEVRVAVPLELLGLDEGSALTSMEGSAVLGAASLDEVALADAEIPSSRLELGVAPPSAPQEEVPFSAQADLVEGRFSGTLDASSLPPGAYRVWARACLGESCGTRWVDVG